MSYWKNKNFYCFVLCCLKIKIVCYYLNVTNIYKYNFNYNKIFIKNIAYIFTHVSTVKNWRNGYEYASVDNIFKAQSHNLMINIK